MFTVFARQRHLYIKHFCVLLIIQKHKHPDLFLGASSLKRKLIINKPVKSYVLTMHYILDLGVIQEANQT